MEQLENGLTFVNTGALPHGLRFMLVNFAMFSW
jgi:hypothetical protein